MSTSRETPKLSSSVKTPEPVRMPAIRGLGHQLDAAHVREGMLVAERVRAARLDPRLEDLELPATDAREHVAHAVVETDLAMLVPGDGLTGLRRPEARLIDPGAVTGDEHSAARRRDDLVPVEGEDADRRAHADLAPTIVRPERLRSVLQDRDVVARAHFLEAIEVGALPVEVHDDDRLRKLATPGAVRERFREEVGVDVPAARLAVDEDRPGSLVRDRIRGGGEGQRRANHIVAALHAEKLQSEVNRRRAAAQRQARKASDQLRERSLERVDVGTDRRHPVRRERLANVGLFVATDVRRREVDAAHLVWILARPCARRKQPERAVQC